MIRRIHSKAVLTGAVVALVAGLAVGIGAQAQGKGQGEGPGRRGGGGPGGGPGRSGFPGLAQLELTEAQRQQVRDVMQRHREDMQEAGKRLRDAHEAQRAAVETVPVNEGLIRSTGQTLANAQTDMALLEARIHSDIWALLTPDQQEKAKNLKEKRETRTRERMDRRQQRRPGQ